MFKSGKTDIKIYKELWETILNGKIWSGELYNKKKTGELYWESVKIAPVSNNYNEITNFIAIKEDITSKKIAEEKLKKNNLNLKVMSDCHFAILVSNTKDELLENFCHLVTGQFKLFFLFCYGICISIK